AGRAPYEPRHVGVRSRRRARLRPQDRRRHAGRGAAQRGRHRRLSGDDRMTALLLEANGLCAYYGATQALFGLDLAVEAGGATTLLAGNGAGKTTALRALSGMVRASGEIRFDGRPIGGRAVEQIVRLGIAHVPQGRGTFVRQTVEENFQIAAMPR